MNTVIRYSLIVLAAYSAHLSAATWNVTVNGTSQGRAFEGIGAVSAGANTRLLIDYPEPYRSDILDFLFKPKFGAGFQHLKVEIGCGTNSTCGAEPSHAITRAELTNPVSRGYEFWFMKEARNRNPQIILDCLPWGFPYWLSSRFSQDSAEYFVSFLKAARDQWGLELNWVAAAQNESGTNLNWVTNKVRPAMNTAGFSAVQIQAPDNSWNYWYEFADFAAHPDYDAVVKAAGYHYIDYQNQYPSAEVIATGKPLWSSEDAVNDGMDWTMTREMVARMNRYYIKGKITKMELWCPIDSCAEGVLLCDVGAMEADTPWSGKYFIRNAVWGIAHYTQFAEPGWVYLDSSCGTLSGAGNYVALKSPTTNDYSIIIYSQQAEKITFTLSGGLSSNTLQVWKTTSSSRFVRQADITPVGNEFTLNCSAESLYSLTTTSGQQKGQPPHPIPANTRFPFPYSENFDSYTTGATPKYFSDMQGTFEVADCKGGRTGKCLQQVVPQIGYTWGGTWCNPPAPMTILSSEMDWTNYEAGVDVYIENGEVYLAVRKGAEQKNMGYALVLNKNGEWRLSFDDITNLSAILLKGVLAGFDGQIWHTITLRCADDQIDGFIDGRLVCSIRDARRTSGQVCVGGSFDLNQYDNLSVRPAGPAGSSWTILDDTHPSLVWGSWWGNWSQGDYYNGTCKYTELVGASATFTFTGRQGQIVGLRRNDLGYVAVYLDGQLQTQVDCYSANTQYQSVLYQTQALPLASHTIRLEVTGQQNPDSTGVEIVLDAFAYSQNTGSWCPYPSENLALSAAASASSIWSADYSAAKANDANSLTRWNTSGSDINGSWLELDLGRQVTFNRIRITEYESHVRGYKIQYYSQQWKDAYTGSTILSGGVVSFSAVTGSKVRLWIDQANDCPSIYEFEVFPSEADLNGDSRVDFTDIALFCTLWLDDNCDSNCNCTRSDILHDGTVDMKDFAVFAGQYLP